MSFAERLITNRSEAGPLPSFEGEAELVHGFNRSDAHAQILNAENVILSRHDEGSSVSAHKSGSVAGSGWQLHAALDQLGIE